MKRVVSNSSENKPSVRRKVSGGSLSYRSRITNGSALLECVDGRSSWARRFRDLVHAYTTDLGGEQILSEGQKALARRAALLQVELEFQEARLARMHEDGKVPSSNRIESYGRNANTLRRLIESLGLQDGRKARDVTPTRDATGQIIDAIRAGVA